MDTVPFPPNAFRLASQLLVIPQNMNGKQPFSKCDISNRPVLLLAGDFSWQHVDVASLARRFDWEVQVATELLPGPANGEVRAVFCPVEGNDFQPIEAARRLYPRARIVACSRFRSPVDWDRMEASGAFHHLRLPFEEHEVKLSLGFLDTAMSAEAFSVAPASQPTRQFVPARDSLRRVPVRHSSHFRRQLRPA